MEQKDYDWLVCWLERSCMVLVDGDRTFDWVRDDKQKTITIGEITDPYEILEEFVIDEDSKIFFDGEFTVKVVVEEIPYEIEKLILERNA